MFLNVFQLQHWVYPGFLNSKQCSSFFIVKSSFLSLWKASCIICIKKSCTTCHHSPVLKFNNSCKLVKHRMLLNFEIFAWSSLWRESLTEYTKSSLGWGSKSNRKRKPNSLPAHIMWMWILSMSFIGQRVVRKWGNISYLQFIKDSQQRGFLWFWDSLWPKRHTSFE